MSLEPIAGSALSNLTTHVRLKKEQAFDFGVYKSIQYDQATQGRPLVENAEYLKCWLLAGISKVHMQMIRQILRILEVKFQDQFKINPTSSDFAGFTAYVVKRTNMMLYHLRRLRRPDKRQNCLSRMKIPSEIQILKELVSMLPDDKDRPMTI